MGAAWIGAIAAVAGAASSAKGAYDANKANKRSLASEQARIAALLDEIDIGRANAAELRDERDVPSELFAQILSQYPGLLARVLPQLTEQTGETTAALTAQNVANFRSARDSLYPGVDDLNASRLRAIQSLDPENLGEQELAAISRQLSPLIPAGTLTKEGAVQGATTNPVSLYRNLISGLYSSRRSDYLAAASNYAGEANNAATRQQVGAGEFLSGILNTGFTTSLGLAEADIEQQQADIDAQEAFIRLAASGLASTYDPSANNALIAQGIKGTTDGLAKAAESLSTKYGNNNSGGNAKQQLS